MLQKSAHLTVALAYESNYGDIGRTLPRHCPKQRALSNSASAEDSDSLPKPAWKQSVYGANPGYKGSAYMLTLKGSGRSCKQLVAGMCFNGRPPINESAKSVHDTPQQARTNSDTRIFRPGVYRIAWLQAIYLLQRHGKDAPIAKARDLRSNGPASSGVNLAEAANG